MKNVLIRINNILNSRRFFWGVLLFFILESAWIAMSAVYPQAFDEDFHFGLIKIYAHYWLPFLSSQPPNANAYGAVFRDPSYLYHYAMSFPYRLIALVVHGQTGQVIIMRYLNIALAALGLILFRRVLLKAKLSRALTNVSMLLFVLIPVVPQLAGQINYDNLLFPLVAWTCLLAMQAADEFLGKRPSIRTLLTLVAVCSLTSLVKYEFLPIALGTGIFVVYLAYKNFNGSWPQLGARLAESWRNQSHVMQVILVLATIVGIGLFVQRDGINLVKYHALEPDCGAILNEQSCNAYGPWEASHSWHKDVVANTAAGTPEQFMNPITYTGSWLYWLWYRLFFAINGPASGYTNYPPLPLPAAAALLVCIFGAVAVVARRKLLRHNPYILFFVITIVIYLAALWGSGYMQYRSTHVPVLMNGRYLLPILFLVAAIIGKPVASLLRHNQTLRVSIATLTLLFFIEGGGVFTFIMRSDASWDWPNSAAVKTNDAARKILHPFIIEGKKTYDTTTWLFN